MNGLAICAGVGGLELGMGFIFPSSRIICYIEREPYAASVIVERMETEGLHKAPIWDDVRTFPSRKFVGKVDFITAGFPCTPFSKAGKQQGIDDERWLWEDIESIINTLEPKYIFLENVPEITSRGFDRVLATMAKSGYDVQWSCLKASSVGAPHKRDRIFVLGFRPEWLHQLTNSMRDGFSRFTNEENSERITREGIMEGDVSKCYGEDVTDSKCESQQRRGISREIHGKEKENQGKNGSKQRNPPIDSSPDVTKSNSQRSLSWWEIEPPICRVDDGLAYRMDRLRTLGNGVVPLQAAYAYSSLVLRANGIERSEFINGVRLG